MRNCHHRNTDEPKPYYLLFIKKKKKSPLHWQMYEFVTLAVILKIMKTQKKNIQEETSWPERL